MKKQARKLSRKKPVSSCDWAAGTAKAGSASGLSAVYRHRGNCRWKGVKPEKYKTVKGEWDSIIRSVLVGDGVKTKSHVRYFEIAPGGRSSFEQHRHEHIVIGIKGSGRVLLGKKKSKINYLDVVYVSPGTPHQFLNPFDEPFGFICIVSSKRDRPVLLS